MTDHRRDYWRPRMSPDGSRVAVEVFDGKAEHIWVVSLETGVSTQITFTGGDEQLPGLGPRRKIDHLQRHHEGTRHLPETGRRQR